MGNVGYLMQMNDRQVWPGPSAFGVTNYALNTSNGVVAVIPPDAAVGARLKCASSFFIIDASHASNGYATDAGSPEWVPCSPKRNFYLRPGLVGTGQTVSVMYDLVEPDK